MVLLFIWLAGQIKKETLNDFLLRAVAISYWIVLLFAGLILMQPDFGTMLFRFQWHFYAFAAGINWKILFMASAEPRLLYIYLLK